MVSGILSLSFFLFGSTLCLINHVTATVRFTNETDRQALLAIKGLISTDPTKVLSSWNDSLHFCTWQGVTCGRRHQRVTALKLSSLQLAGSLSPHVGNLTFLRRINLSTNNFHGTIPQEVSRLFRLQFLALADNSFQGELPRNLSHCSNLRFLNLQANNLTGKIPSKFGSLSKLYQMVLAKNHFIGPIPHSFGNLSSLSHLKLNDNNLEGSIPIELGHLSKLEYLHLSFNHLSGVVPKVLKVLYNTSSIYFISIGFNYQISGTLPLDLGSRLPNLQFLYLPGNQLSGLIPKSIVNVSGLVDCDLSFNALTGPIPKNLGNLQNLQILDFGSNPFGDENDTDLTFLTSLTNCTNLIELSLFDCQLRGFLPNSIANLSTNLYWLSLQNNSITGDVPSEIGNLKNLQYVTLAENMFTGRLTESVGKLSKLKEFYVYTNQISGKIPSSFGNISALLILNLRDNLLEGSIPISLANCIRLNSLDLQLNYLTGVIPEKIFSLSSITLGLSLASNDLTGSLPSQVGNMKFLLGLDISDNKLSGQIPSALENCLMLEFLYIGGNFFEGAIPYSFKKLRSIQDLDLSSNNLSGKIPKFLGELLLLGNLNLSFNDFEGELPTEGIFNNASAFSVVGNQKLCGGIKAIQLSACPKRKQKNRFPRRVVVLVSIVSLFILSLLSCIFLFIYRKRVSRKRKPLLASSLRKKYQKVSYADLVHATDGFSSANLIGDGRFGTVYKGILRPDDQIVAVKVLKLQQQGANKAFAAECEVLRSIKHRNLLRVVTACSSIDLEGNEFKALVFDFMPHGSLESWLHPSSVELQVSRRLSLLRRINMLIDVASALDYLHNHYGEPVVHCDLKPSNILLDNDLTAHVGDFGLARILSAATGESLSTSSSSLGVRGTIGYVAPEYGMGGQVSVSGDMYSYGVLLLEMLTGRRPTDGVFTGNFNLHNFAKAALPDQVLEIVDPLLTFQDESRLGRTGPSTSRGNTGKIEECLASIFHVGVLCSADLPSDRMVIEDVLSELNKIRKILCSK